MILKSQNLFEKIKNNRDKTKQQQQQQQQQLQLQTKKKYSDNTKNVEVIFKSISEKPTKKQKDLKKDLLNTNITQEEQEDVSVIDLCCCCNTVLKHPKKITKFKCSACHITITLDNNSDFITEHNASELTFHTPKLDSLQDLIYQCDKKYHSFCISNNNNFIKTPDSKDTNYLARVTHDIYNPIEIYIEKSFSKVILLNNAFKNSKNTAIIDYIQLVEFYDLILNLPTKRPFYRLLLCCNELLRRPNTKLIDNGVMVTSAHPSRNNSNGENNGGLTLRNFKWVLILLEIPILKYSVIQQNHNKTTSNHAINKYGKYNTPQIRALSYEILKRCIGYLSCVPPYVAKELIYNLQCWDDQKFNNRIDLINLYITFHVNRIIYHALPHNFTTTPNKATLNASDKLHSPTLQEFEEGNGETSNKDASSASGEAANENVLTQAFNSFWCGLGNSNNNINTNGKSNANIPKHFKLSLAKYGFDWHLQTAAQLLIYFFGANQRTKKCFVSHFYNTLLDFIDYKKDFETWKKLKKIEIKHHRHNNSNASSNLTVFDSEYRPRLTLCQYPFLLSLGIKVLMMEYEAKKVMEQKAEEAFLNAIGSNKIVDVYFRIKIRRDHITQDSLRCISSNNNNHNLHKSLKVEFIDEPGLDAGGLKKEWFLLLTSKLFNPTNGLFVNIDESNLFWFSIGNPNGAGATRTNRNNNELYYLFGVVLGLAIFNSTILDLNFPLALYKKLCGEKLTMQDYIELYPESGKNLMKLFNYNKVDFTSVFDLYFETCYQDCFGTKHTVELRPNGSKIPVTNENKADFVYLWMDFYLNKSILDKFNSFTTGFIKVVNGDSFKLFSSEELEQLCCGSTSNGMNSGKIDIESLKTITKYAGSFSSITGRNHKWDGNALVIQWFWEIFKDMTYDEQKKLLQFVTGSYRLPATGASSMIFRITRLGPDSEHLPLAHTCFNELCLYEYKTKEKLKKKILFAIQETEGYGFR